MKTQIILSLLAVCMISFAGTAFTLKIEPQKTKYVIHPKESGTYWIVTHSESLIPAGKQHFASLQINDGPVLQRRLIPYNGTKLSQRIERIALQAGKEYTVFFKYDTAMTKVTKICFEKERPYSVPKPAQNYKPKLLPPKYHPRVLVNPEYLTELKKNLTAGDNLPVWMQVKQQAFQPFAFKVQPGKEVKYDPALLAAAEAKAFYYLVTGDKKIGREAAELTLTYMKNISFGNGQDVTRKVGEAVFCASLVYDWCYSLFSAAEKEVLRGRMLFYAAEMECRWPPFRLSPTAGHGNETMFTRELLSMAIAVYDEDPLPYQYIAYQMLEVWQPLKSFMHKSGRHSQGSSYGKFRVQFDFLGALQFKRTFGIDVFPKEAGELPYYWYYMRLPDGCSLIEGDDNWKVNRPQYIPINPLLLNCLMALYPNPDFKMELQRGKKLSKPMDPVLFLLSNNPALKPQDLRAKLPLTRLYKSPLPGMAVRTGWNFTPDSNDLVLTMNGGHYHLRNHQHGDLGSFQLFYRGYLIQDLGQYNIYGLPYDRMLNKTAALHSMMRFYDPHQKRPPKLNHWLNVGGQNVEDDRPPSTLKQLLTDERYYCGETPHAGFGPLKQKPIYNFMEMSLAPAYRSRLDFFTRTFVFWNQDQFDRPGTLLILDRFTTKRPDIIPIFQLTTVQKTEWKNGILSIRSTQGNRTGCVSVTPLIPQKADVKILSGNASRTFQNVCVPARFPKRAEANGNRIEVIGKGNTYLNALQIHGGQLKPLPVSYIRTGNRIQLLLSDERADYLTVFGDVNKPDDKTFSITIKRNGTNVLLLDLVPGQWEIVNANKKIKLNTDKTECAVYAKLDSGTWKIRHLSDKGAK